MGEIPMEPKKFLRCPSPTPDDSRKGWGIFLIVFGFVGGSIWTFAILLGEDVTQRGLFSTENQPPRWNGVPLPSILILVAAVSWLAAGVVMVINATQSPQETIAASIASILLVVAVCCCLAAFALEGLFNGVYYYGSALTGLATIATIIAGDLLIRTDTFSNAQDTWIAKGLAAVGLGLAITAAAAYLFGFVVCLAGK
jgi:hypothetical protein